ncbi:NAD(P)H-dependent flavin oxidoreductase [Saccharopolyspora elongata]|uniref:NAD(P)H-dependent flavin oxidoreductase n=1 Tax=Saccharopolyspora elongata TaxID=2530387 RepID=UPI001A9D1043|nr:nitronate monooxygenase [Saccharopolyspora elongata]
MIPTRLTAALGIEQPVLLAPMDKVADARLASAVSAAGGLGLLGGGYCDREWLDEQLASVSRRVGCGFITWCLARNPELLDVALDHDPAAVFLSFGDPMPFADRIHDSGVPLLCQVCTVEEARRALDAGARVLVAQGGEAGGHGTGTRSTLTLVPELADLLAARSPDTLLVASGGVADGRGLAAALCLGADGVLMGSRLWASTEAAVSAAAQRRALASSGDDTVRQSVYDIVRAVDWPSHYTGRVLRNDFVRQWHGHEQKMREDLPRLQEVFKNAKDNDDYSIGNVIVGEAIGLIDELEPVKAIIDRVVREASSILVPT